MTQQKIEARKTKKRKRSKSAKSESKTVYLTNSVQKPIYGKNLPYKMKCNFLYGDVINLNPAIASVTSRVFSANGLYDPDISGTGHQPRGFDQLMALYDHYVVIGSKITVRWANSHSAGTLLAVSVQDNITTSSDPQDMLEAVNSTYHLASAVGGGPSAIMLTNQVNPMTFLGRKNALDDPQLKGSASQNPSEGCYYHVSLWTPDGTDPPTQALTVQIEYSALLIEPKRPSGS